MFTLSGSEHRHIMYRLYNYIPLSNTFDCEMFIPVVLQTFSFQKMTFIALITDMREKYMSHFLL